MYTGVLGLKTSQNAMNIVSHNLANVNTEGYVRQQATFTDTQYSKIRVTTVNTWQVGLGVASDTTQHIRDYFLDKSYRLQSGREGFYSAQTATIEEIELIFGELEGQAFQESLTDLKEALAEVAKTPDGLVERSALVMCAEEFLTRSNMIYEDLISYQKNLNVKINSIVDRVNSLGQQINTLNLQISSFEATGIEKANDLRDQRDLALDELAKLVDIRYEENENNIVTVKVEGVDFVTEYLVFPMGTAELDGEHGSTYLSAVWPYLDNKEVFYFANDVSTDLGNDVGELKGLLMARGDYVANYTDMPDETADDYEEQLRYYHDNVEYSSLMSVQAMFDQLVNGVVTKINGILCPEKEITLAADATYTLEDGTTVTYNAGQVLRVLDMDKTSYGTDANQTPGTELFKRCDAERYTKAYDAAGNEVYIFNELNEFGDESLYTLGNLEINKVILDDYSFIPLTTKEGDADYDKAEQLFAMWEENFQNLNPDNLTPKTFMEYYTALTSDIANRGYLYSDVTANQETVVKTVGNARESIYGVSSDEELSNLIKFQNAYNANSRYITTVSQMIEHIINAFGT